MRTLILASLVFLAAPLEAQEAGKIVLELSPSDADGDGVIDHLSVQVDVDRAPHGFKLAISANNVVTSAPNLTDVAFTQNGRILSSEIQDEEEDASNTTRRWTVSGEGPISVSYNLAIDPEREELALPQYELRTGRHGFSGAGLAFLVLPDDELARTVRVDWDLSNLSGKMEAASSLGMGDAQSTRPLRTTELASTYFMAGYPNLFSDEAFFAAWQGTFSFSGDDLMRWAAKLHHYYGSFFGQVPESFGVFGRTNTLNPGSGIGLTDSFAFTFDESSTQEDLKGLLAHEMLHAWVRSLSDTMDAANGLEAAWFGEGLAVHYQRLLPWRAGLIDDEAFLEDLNSTAARYYTNVMIHTPNSEIPAGFWRDTRVRVLPYDRGSLYFAKLDADIRAVSGGTRSLDDIVRIMLAERRAGRPMDRALFEHLLRAELGEEGINQFRAMLEGAVSILPSDTFGPCFARVQKPLRRFDLGFDPEVLVSSDRVVRGLKGGSAAAQAGLRNGDRIQNRFPQDSMQANQAATLTLRIERNGQEREITYLPRGETVLVFQWEAHPC